MIHQTEPCVLKIYGFAQALLTSGLKRIPSRITCSFSFLVTNTQDFGHLVSDMPQETRTWLSLVKSTFGASLAHEFHAYSGMHSPVQPRFK